MFYRYLNIPSIIETGEGLLSQINELLLQNHLYFRNKILFTQEKLLGLYKNDIVRNNYSRIILIRGGEYEEIDELNILGESFKDALLIAFGGGSVIDTVKILAKKTDNSYLTIPSTLSNDAIYSPIARLNVKGKKQSFGAHAPLGIVVDTEIIKKSPERLLLAGVGDLLSNLSAVQDCELAEKYNGEKVDSFATSLATLSATSILLFSKDDIKSTKFIECLANGLILSGVSMVLSKNSKPASGAEHLISHAIDEYYPEKSTLHGIQVAWAQLLLEKRVRKNSNSWVMLESYFERIGLLDLIRSEIRFNEDDFIRLLPLAKTIRNRFSILNIEWELEKNQF